jgi:uncharacterized phosphatase
MVSKKEFYFVRHGQTDLNLGDGKNKQDHPKETPLNKTGREQAFMIEPIVALLPIQTICASPMQRAQETKEIIAARLQAPHHQIQDLGECTGQVWNSMSNLGMYSLIPIEGEVRLFMERVRAGLNHALSLPGPALIVAHGGVHWAICCLMDIKNHEWAIHNCGVVHFSVNDQEKWTALKLA